MKKIILALAAAILSAGLMSAQDMATATETYNNGAELLSLGDKAAALASFQEALKMGQACGEEGAELVANCKKVIPGIILSIGKEFYNKKSFDEALAKVDEAKAAAEAYGDQEILDEIVELVPQINGAKNMFEANNAFKAKDFAAAAAAYRKVLDGDPANGNAALRLVQCLSNSGDIDGAKEALAIAEANGQGENAKSVIGKALLKKAQATLKAGKNAEVIALAEESLQYDDNASAYYLAGSAASKLGKDADAIEYYEKFLAADPDNKNAAAITFTIAALYQKSGNKAKALENYKKISSDAKFGAQAQQQIAALNK